jgi:hypothetical protein
MKCLGINCPFAAQQTPTFEEAAGYCCWKCFDRHAASRAQASQRHNAHCTKVWFVDIALNAKAMAAPPLLPPKARPRRRPPLSPKATAAQKATPPPPPWRQATPPPPPTGAKPPPPPAPPTAWTRLRVQPPAEAVAVTQVHSVAEEGGPVRRGTTWLLIRAAENGVRQRGASQQPQHQHRQRRSGGRCQQVSAQRMPHLSPLRLGACL